MRQVVRSCRQDDAPCYSRSLRLRLDENSLCEGERATGQCVQERNVFRSEHGRYGLDRRGSRTEAKRERERDDTGREVLGKEKKERRWSSMI